jgi:hypothetical protein
VHRVPSGQQKKVWATFELLMCGALVGRDPEPLIAGLAEQQLASLTRHRVALGRAFVAAAAGNAEMAIPLLAEAGDAALRYRGSLFEHDGWSVAPSSPKLRAGTRRQPGCLQRWVEAPARQLRRLPLVP